MKTLKKLSRKVIQRRLAKLDEEIRALQLAKRAILDRCSHEGGVYYSPDPSGNNDSEYCCRHCNASWRTRPEGV